MEVFYLPMQVLCYFLKDLVVEQMKLICDFE